MSKQKWITTYNNVSSLSLREVVKVINKMTPHPIGNLTIRQLSTLPNPVVGLYFVYREGQLVYVGKASSRSFVERLPAHFDPRHDGWFNTLPRKVAKDEGVDLNKAHSTALDYSVAILCIDPSEPIQKFETILRSYMQPILNSGRGGRFNNHDVDTLAQIVNNCL